MADQQGPQDQEGRGGPKRIQFEFPPESLERLNKLKQEAGVSSYADVVRRALQVYEWVIDAQQDGFEIAAVRKKVVKIIKFLY
jgi:hypothetical protein